MFNFLIQRAKWIIAIVGILIFCLTQTEWFKAFEPCQRAENLLIDCRYLFRGAKLPNPNIQIVGVQNSSIGLDALAPEEIAASPALQLMQKPWPWDRRVYAAVLEKLMDAHAKVVVFDFVFASQTDGDETFARALQKYKDRVVIGATFASDPHGLEVKYVAPNEKFLATGADELVGVVNLWPDFDGVTRSTIYRTSIAREYERQFHGQLPPSKDDLIHITVLAAKKFGTTISSPPPDETSFIDFQGPEKTYSVLPIEQMFVNKLWKSKTFDSGIVFSNKIVIVGPIAEIFHDIHQTPFGEMPGPEVQAQTMDGLLRNSFIFPSSTKTDIFLELLMLAIALGICLFIDNALGKVLLLAAATIIFLAASQIIFARGNLLLNMTPALFCLIATGLLGIIFQFFLEQVERARYRNVLERYVSKNVAKTILEDRRTFIESLRGRKYAVTVLFSDIRGFTSMTETADPNKLVAQLNEYFLEMVGIVLKEAGTLQKFIGDAIMSAWGDTHSEGATEDARRAVSAALQMRGALAKLNERWKNFPDRAKLEIGVGVNHGEVIVGNIGHPQRMEFTVLGDGVNLASRLESATKQFHTDILIGETVEALTREQFIFRRVDLLAVKGKAKPVEVFTLLGDISQSAPAWLPKYHDAIQLYRNRKFEAATEQFRNALHEIGKKDFLCEMYLERCAEYIKTPPSENWSGVHVLTEK